MSKEAKKDLQAENERLRQALAEILSLPYGFYYGAHDLSHDVKKIARQALEEVNQ